MGLVIDTSAWIEVFRESEIGEMILEHIKLSDKNVTPTIVLAEMRSAYFRRDYLDSESFYDDLEIVKRLSDIVNEIDERVAISAGDKYAKIHTAKNDISHIDCILWMLAEDFECKVISTDRHFENCPVAIYLKFLFSMNVELEKELNRGVVPEILKNMFKTKSIPLSENLLLQKEENDKWVITDEETKNTYIIRKENELNIFYLNKGKI